MEFTCCIDPKMATHYLLLLLNISYSKLLPYLPPWFLAPFFLAFLPPCLLDPETIPGQHLGRRAQVQCGLAREARQWWTVLTRWEHCAPGSGKTLAALAVLGAAWQSRSHFNPKGTQCFV